MSSTQREKRKARRAKPGPPAGAGISGQIVEAALQTAVGAIIIIDDRGIIQSANPAVANVFGFEPGELLGESVNVLMPEPYRSRHDGYLKHHLDTGEKRIIGIGREVTGRRKNGALFPIHLAVSSFEADGRRFFTGVVHDLSRQAAQPQLREQMLLQAIFNQMPDALVVTDSAGRIVLCNPAVAEVFEYTPEDLIGREFESLCETPAECDKLKAIVDASLEAVPFGRKLVPQPVRMRYRRRSGAAFPAQAMASVLRDQNGALVGVLSLSRDISTQVEREEALHKSQRLEALGQLTGGIAHDFNNLLTIITGNHELLEHELETASQRDLLARANNAALMGGRLTNRLLTFARRRRLEPVLIDLNEQVLSMAELLRRTLGENLAFATLLAPRLWLVRTDPSEIENAVLNLAINARDAMPQGGKLVIETRNVVLTEQDLAGEEGASPGEYVRLSVSDSGVGMPPEVLSRAFEPFFTTKPTGKGTGLGLSVIYGFVRQSGGNITLESRVGKGTTVTIYLPRAEEKAARPQAPHRPVLADGSHDETILLVEDNDDVRAVTARRLRRLGYKVEMAETARRAIDILRSDTSVDLVFSDIVMPGGLSGFDLAQWIRVRMPHLPVLLTTGYAEEMEKAGEVGLDGLDIIRKPYTSDELAAALHKILRPKRTDRA
ncbi:MAG: PAS domain S-box protein [Hyphomicrobiaceae bacterium]|nr:PAS domain S-box protein [Hyphomicrobiaceae bacterium]